MSWMEKFMRLWQPSMFC